MPLARVEHGGIWENPVPPGENAGGTGHWHGRGTGMAWARRGQETLFWLGVARAWRGHVLFPLTPDGENGSGRGLEADRPRAARQNSKKRTRTGRGQYRFSLCGQGAF
eukprot:gene13042-biopygen11040